MKEYPSKSHKCLERQRQKPPTQKGNEMTKEEIIDGLENLAIDCETNFQVQVCDSAISLIESQAKRIEELEAKLTKEREALSRFLVPYRRSLPQSWLDHFVESGAVYFDEIGFVFPSPINAALKQSEKK